jgi:flagellar biosynthesis/type III secretory pathway protein FliH
MLSQESHKFEASKDYTARPCQKWKDGRRRGREGGKEEGRKEVRKKEGRKEGKKEGRKAGMQTKFIFTLLRFSTTNLSLYS